MHSALLGSIITYAFSFLNREIQWQGLSGTITFTLWEVLCAHLIILLFATFVFSMLKSYLRRNG